MNGKRGWPTGIDGFGSDLLADCLAEVTCNPVIHVAVAVLVVCVLVMGIRERKASACGGQTVRGRAVSVVVAVVVVSDGVVVDLAVTVAGLGLVAAVLVRSPVCCRVVGFPGKDGGVKLAVVSAGCGISIGFRLLRTGCVGVSCVDVS